VYQDEGRQVLGILVAKLVFLTQSNALSATVIESGRSRCVSGYVARYDGTFVGQMTGFHDVDGEDAWHTVLIEWLPGRTGRGGDALSRLMDRLSIEVSWHKLFGCVVGFHSSFHIAISRSCPKRCYLCTST
jgi:hypothetical protein